MDEHDSYKSAYIPERFREDYDPRDAEPIEPERMGPSFHGVDPRDVLDPQEYHEYRQERRRRRRRSR